MFSGLKNWKTSVFGTLAGLAGYVAVSFPRYAAVASPLAALFTGLVGLYAKDATTGSQPR
jgi:TctA family transporter